MINIENEMVTVPCVVAICVALVFIFGDIASCTGKMFEEDRKSLEIREKAKNPKCQEQTP